ncbi:MAG: HRDC domain-containing protein [Opitutales bacterium]|jgi:ribonuclease D|nr:HRDC domain-containing protein [Opitutales bacterium]MDP4645486.1 HRDC domain-containing protein [Opitutales bacterium]MDP4884661.1 HRDC domain-containing protein [Opitutales bacterium]MDP5080662.1 HRDC domain-containing protein [Opitutales bacterium]
MITTTEALAEAVRAAQAAGAVGIDTEFIWDRTFYPTLGLVQIGYPDGHCELVDAPEIEDWSPFAELMSDASVVKILHDAQQDLTILYRASGGYPKNIFDSQRSAGFAGLSSTISLSELLKTLEKVRLDKSETRSNWLARPLTEAQVEYAEDDVRYSTRLMVKIMDRAEKLGRKDWILEEMKMYEVESLYGESDPELEMPRVRGSGSLTNQQRNILRALGAWREIKARKRNLPRNFILSDDAIVSLLKHPPKTADDIRPMKGLSDRALERNRRYIWEAIQRGIEGDLPELPNGRHTGPAPDDGYEARVDLSLAFIKGTCLAAKIDPALIGNRAEVTALVLEAANATDERHRILRGWRGEFCGKHLLSILQGNGSITINSETKLPEYHD